MASKLWPSFPAPAVPADTSVDQSDAGNSGSPSSLRRVGPTDARWQLWLTRVCRADRAHGSGRKGRWQEWFQRGIRPRISVRFFLSGRGRYFFSSFGGFACSSRTVSVEEADAGVEGGRGDAVGAGLGGSAGR